MRKDFKRPLTPLMCTSRRPTLATQCGHDPVACCTPSSGRRDDGSQEVERRHVVDVDDGQVEWRDGGPEGASQEVLQVKQWSQGRRQRLSIEQQG